MAKTSVLQIEKYRKGNVTTREELEVGNEVSSQNRANLCKSLGFDIQSNVVNNAGELAKGLYRELTPYEAYIWSSFLPTYYSKAEGRWKAYQFDIIPEEALREIGVASNLGLFTDIEIWTPEKTNIDPAAIGVIGNRTNRRHLRSGIGIDSTTFFLISRWGESLKPFEEIEKEILTRKITFFNGVTHLPKPVVNDGIMNLLRQNYTIQSLSFGGSKTIFKKHCGQRMYTLHGSHHVTICSVCGFISNCSVCSCIYD